MVDWDRVDKRRSQGWEWDRIAADPKVDFHPEASAGDPGRALRAMYFQRRSRGKRADAPGGGPADDPGPAGPDRTNGRIAYIGFLATPLFAIWFLLAVVFPAPVGTYLPAVPGLALLLAAAAIVLGFGLLRSVDKWSTQFRNACIFGVILGLVIAAAVGGVAVINGCPTLTSSTSSVPDTAGVVGSPWEHAANSEWTESGVPVFFFYGSIACPYCSASSWAMALALEQFGTMSGTSYGHSSSTDVDPDTPETILASASLTSQYVALHVDESTDDAAITTPPTPSCIDSAYVSAYDSTGSIPFVAIGGQYIHVGTLVDPTQLRTTPGDGSSNPLTPTQVAGELTNQSGAAWNAIAPAAYIIEALLCILNHDQPAGLAANPNVAPIIKQVSG